MNEEVEKILYQLNKDIKDNSHIYLEDDNSLIKSKNNFLSLIGNFYDNYLYFHNLSEINYSNKKTDSLKNQIISNYNFFMQLAGKTEIYSSKDKFTIWNVFNNKVFTLIYKANMSNHKLMLYPHVIIRDNSHIKSKNKVVKLAFDTQRHFEKKDYILFERTIYDTNDSFKELNEAFYSIYIKPIIKIDSSEFNKEWFDILNMINLK